MKEERKYAIEACRGICDSLAEYGFVTAKNGLSASRMVDKDIGQEICFQINRYQQITIHFHLYSRKVKDWYKERYQLKDAGLLTGLGEQLGYITPGKDWHEWYIAKSDLAKEQFRKEALERIHTYLLPYLEKFRNLPGFIEELYQSGGKISPWHNSCRALPLIFVWVYEKEKAQSLLDKYIDMNPIMKKYIIENEVHTEKFDP